MVACISAPVPVEDETPARARLSSPRPSPIPTPPAKTLPSKTMFAFSRPVDGRQGRELHRNRCQPGRHTDGDADLDDPGLWQPAAFPFVQGPISESDRRDNRRPG